MFSSDFVSFRFLGALEITGQINLLSEVQIFLSYLDDSILTIFSEWFTFGSSLPLACGPSGSQTKRFYQSSKVGGLGGKRQQEWKPAETIDNRKRPKGHQIIGLWGRL